MNHILLILLPPFDTIVAKDWKRYHSSKDQLSECPMPPPKTHCHQIIYISSSVGLPSHDELRKILNVSRVLNKHDGITGLLLHHDGSFMQILEGNPEATRELFSKIQKDPRHRNIIKLSEKSTTSRLFPNWSMALASSKNYNNAGENETQSFQEVTEKLIRIKEKDSTASILIESFFKTFQESRLLPNGWRLET